MLLMLMLENVCLSGDIRRECRWHAFLWYCYTGELDFGKLKSQVEPGGQHFRETSLEGGPPTCSPKSMYRLANLVSTPMYPADKGLKVFTGRR